MTAHPPLAARARRRRGPVRALVGALGLALGGAPSCSAPEAVAPASAAQPPRDGRPPAASLGAARQDPAPQPCAGAADCAGRCSVWYEDRDRDGFGDPETARGYCGDRAPASGVALVRDGRDCCDRDERVRPTQTAAFAERIHHDCPLARGFDYDCDGVLRYADDLGATVWVGACGDEGRGNDPNVPCVERAGVFLGPASAPSLSPDELVTAEGDAALCGDGSVEWKTCSLEAAGCSGEPRRAPACN